MTFIHLQILTWQPPRKNENNHNGSEFHEINIARIMLCPMSLSTLSKMSKTTHALYTKSLTIFRMVLTELIELPGALGHWQGRALPTQIGVVSRLKCANSI